MTFDPARFRFLRGAKPQGATPAVQPTSVQQQIEVTTAQLALAKTLRREIADHDAAKKPEKVAPTSVVEPETPPPQKSLAEREAEIKAEREAKQMEEMEAKFSSLQPAAVPTTDPPRFTPEERMRARSVFQQHARKNSSGEQQ